MKQPKPESYPLLRDAYAVIDGIPEERFNLNAWRVTRECGTVACAAGWLMQHPDMQAKGLYMDSYGSPTFKGLLDYTALEAFFGLRAGVGYALFCPRHTGFYCGLNGMVKLDDYADPDAYPSDKQLFLARVREFLRVEDERATQELPCGQ